MTKLLYTIGFAGKTAQEFFALLKNESIELLVDVRLNRGGQLSGFAKHPDLEFFLKELAGIGYFHEPLLAPTADLLHAYRQSKKWNEYEAAFLGLLRDRKIPESLDTAAWPDRVSLLCSEATPEKCHRRLVADLLSANWNSRGHSVAIRHLISISAATKRPRRKKPSGEP